MAKRARRLRGTTGSLLSKVSEAWKTFFGLPIAYEQRSSHATSAGNSVCPIPAAHVEGLEGRTLFTAVTGWNLYDANTGAVVRTVSEQQTVDLAKLPTRNLNIGPAVAGAAGSVRFTYDSTGTYQVDNAGPYVLAGDGNGPLQRWTPSAGKHSVGAFVYTGDNASGSLATKAYLNFTVTDSGGDAATSAPPASATPAGTTGAPSFAGWNLVNADTGAVIQALSEQQTIDLAKLPTRRLNLQPNASGAIGSIKFTYDTNGSYHVDNGAAFSLAGDANAAPLQAWTPTVAKHSVQALAYAGDNATGNYQGKAVINFTVTDSGGGGGGGGGAGTTSGGGSGDTTSGGGGGTTVSTDPQAPKPVITFIDNTEMVGSAVHVNAVTASTLSVGDPLRTHYQWDFGDPGSKYNTLTGFNAAHVYDRAGTYTVILTMTDSAGRTSVARANVTISADTRRRVYVSSAGNDRNDGSSEGEAVRTVARANQLATGDNVEVLFRRGDTFATAVSLYAGGNNVLIGAYGSGARPTLTTTNALLRDLITAGVNSADVTVQDLNFDSSLRFNTEKSSAARAFTPDGTNDTIRNCTFTNVSDAVTANGEPRGLLVMDNADVSATSLRGYFVWVEGSDVVILGNTSHNSTREHTVRVGGADRVLIADNDFTNLDRTGQGDRSDIGKGTIVIQKGSYVYAGGNTVTDGPIGVGPLGGADGVSDAAARMQYAVVENNHVVDAEVTINAGSVHVAVRNNVIERDRNDAISVAPTDDASRAYAARTITDLLIDNNTAISNGMTGNFLYLEGSTAPGQITMNNNLFVAPNLTPGTAMTGLVYVNDTDLSSFRQITNNVWSVPRPLSYAAGGYFYVLNYWSDPSGYVKPGTWNAFSQVGTDQFQNTALSSTFAPAANSAAATGGTKTDGVFTDYYGKARPNSNVWSAGAVQL